MPETLGEFQGDFYAVYNPSKGRFDHFACLRNAEQCAKELAKKYPGSEQFVFVPLKSFTTNADIKERNYV
jgi:hypothetical protein